MKKKMSENACGEDEQNEMLDARLQDYWRALEEGPVPPRLAELASKLQRVRPRATLLERLTITDSRPETQGIFFSAVAGNGEATRVYELAAADHPEVRQSQTRSVWAREVSEGE